MPHTVRAVVCFAFAPAWPRAAARERREMARRPALCSREAGWWGLR
jgi:hypothetical protein